MEVRVIVDETVEGGVYPRGRGTERVKTGRQSMDRFWVRSRTGTKDVEWGVGSKGEVIPRWRTKRHSRRRLHEELEEMGVGSSPGTMDSKRCRL